MRYITVIATVVRMLMQSLREKATDICVDCIKWRQEFKTDQGGRKWVM